MIDAEIAIAVTPRSWSVGLHRFVADHGGARVRARIMHPEDAFRESFDVLVIDDTTSFLTTHFVHQVQSEGKAVLGVFDEPAGERRLMEMHVDARITAEADPEQFVTTILGLAMLRNVAAPESPAIAPDLHPERGVVVAVGGAGGGVGATETALTLAVTLRRAGARVVLCDFDDVAADLAIRLGLQLRPNLLTALDDLRHTRAPVSESIVTAEAPLLVGVPNPRDWAHVVPGELLDLVDELAAGFEIVVMNLSPLVEPHRFGIARALLPVADTCVVVGSHSPAGVARLIAWMAAIADLIDTGDLHIFVNNAPPERFIRAEIVKELAEFDIASLTFAPPDRQVAAASWEGVALRRGGFYDGCGSLAAALLPVLASIS